MRPLDCRRRRRHVSFIAAALAAASADKSLPAPSHIVESTPSPTAALLERVLPGASAHFDLRVSHAQKGCFAISDAADGRISIVAGDDSLLSAGAGHYLTHSANLVVGWPRGGGSRLATPSAWPTMAATGGEITRCRRAAHSYFMNVCTHSYSLVWYTWAHWEAFIDWMALSGINMFLAMTGQEEVQYRVFEKLGLKDADIRGWFNGPAFLTWSRGQNEYGAGIAGPLPRSFMKQQHAMQQRIVARARQLGIVGQLPAFQGNVPVQLKALLGDSNITSAGDTGWMDSLDPNYGKIADSWMAELTSSFGTDHWYQLDGYFNGGTAPWYSSPSHGADAASAVRATVEASSSPSSSSAVATTATPAAAPRRRLAPRPVGDPLWKRRGEAAYRGLNRTDPHAVWSFQGFAFIGWSGAAKAAALAGFVEAAPSDKFVIVDMDYGAGEWETKFDRDGFWGTPFIWTKLHNFGGTDGLRGNMSIAATIPSAALPPSTAAADARGSSSAAAASEGVRLVGTGFTSEGIDQNPAYYELLLDNHFSGGPDGDFAPWLSSRALRRYGGLAATSDAGTAAQRAWSLLASSVYSQDVSVQDVTGVKTLRAGAPGWSFGIDRATPTAKMCQLWEAWGLLIDVAQAASASSSSSDASSLSSSSSEASPEAAALAEPLTYDLINTGREVLAQLTVPLSLNFSDAIDGESTPPPPLDDAAVAATGGAYAATLADLDELVATDGAFLLGSWIEMAHDLAAAAAANADAVDVDIADTDTVDAGADDADDCTGAGTNVPAEVVGCAHFYEYNARAQLTTWNPTPKGAAQVPSGPLDYSGKHWSGLISGYYQMRVELLTAQARRDAAKGTPLNTTAADALQAQLAFDFQVATTKYPTAPVGDPLAVSKAMRAKYAPRFDVCSK